MQLWRQPVLTHDSIVCGIAGVGEFGEKFAFSECWFRGLFLGYSSTRQGTRRSCSPSHQRGLASSHDNVPRNDKTSREAALSEFTAAQRQ